MIVTTLYRPVGLTELKLIAQSNWSGFPPRLEWQPIFYPVLNQQYAEQIAREWNTEDSFSSYCGIVTQFDIITVYLDTFRVENVGDALHNEYWIPAGELANFNSNIMGPIRIVNAFFGNEFTMPEDSDIARMLSNFQQK